MVTLQLYCQQPECMDSGLGANPVKAPRSSYAGDVLRYIITFVIRHTLGGAPGENHFFMSRKLTDRGLPSETTVGEQEQFRPYLAPSALRKLRPPPTKKNGPRVPNQWHTSGGAVCDWRPFFSWTLFPAAR